MATIRAFLHHGSPPSVFGPLPTAGGTTVPDKVYWTELYDLPTVTAQGYGPPVVIGQVTNAAGVVAGNMQKPADDGYAPPAPNFGVQRVGLVVLFAPYPPALEFTLVSPSNQVSVVAGAPVPAPGGGQVIWITWVLPLAAGLWKIEVRRRVTGTFLPNEYVWTDPNPPGLSEPYVATGAYADGLLALVFDDTGPTTTTTTTTTPTPTTTTTTTTRQPTTTTTTTTITSTTPTTGTSTPTTQTTGTTVNGPGCWCALLLVLGLGLLAASAIAFIAWGCSGFLSAPLLTTGIVAGILSLIVLGIWVLLCRPCAEEVLLAKILLGLAVILVILAVVFALVGQLGCTVGSLITAVLFVVVAATLRLVGKIVGCP